MVRKGGGTAKTTTTFNLAYCLRKMGKRVLAVDFDSQANLTTCFGVDFIPSSIYLSVVDAKLRLEMGGGADAVRDSGAAAGEV